jgi:hypothetical protein
MHYYHTTLYEYWSCGGRQARSSCSAEARRGALYCPGFKVTTGRWCSSLRPNLEDLFPTLWEPVLTKNDIDDCGSTTDFRAHVSPQQVGVGGTVRRHASRVDPNISAWRSFEHGSDVSSSNLFSPKVDLINCCGLPTFELNVYETYQVRRWPPKKQRDRSSTLEHAISICPAWSTFAQSVLPSLERVCPAWHAVFCPAWSTALVLIWKTVRGRKWGSRDARGTATTHVVSVGHKNGRIFPQTIPSIRTQRLSDPFASFYHSTIQTRQVGIEQTPLQLHHTLL